MELVKYLPTDIINYMIPFLNLLEGYTIANEMCKSGVMFLKSIASDENVVEIVKKVHIAMNDEKEYMKFARLIKEITKNCTEVQLCKIHNIFIKDDRFVYSMKIPNETVLKYILKLIVKYDAVNFFNSLMYVLYLDAQFIEFRKTFTYLGKVYNNENGCLLHIIMDENIVKCNKLIELIEDGYSKKIQDSIVCSIFMITLDRSSKHYIILDNILIKAFENSLKFYKLFRK